MGLKATLNRATVFRLSLQAKGLENQAEEAERKDNYPKAESLRAEAEAIREEIAKKRLSIMNGG